MLFNLINIFLRLEFFEEYEEQDKWEEFISNKENIYITIIVVLIFILLIFIGLYSKEKKSNK